ncbi:MAG: SusC/RagA family TonB-linked outer membrane protein [Bacteroidia bacterium]
MKHALLCVFLCLFVLYSQGQERRITGTVTEHESGLLLPGVSVVEKGTTNGTITNVDGKFSLRLLQANSVLVFSFVGMETLELVVGERTQWQVVLKPAAINLKETVVTAVAIAKEKKELGYAVQELKNEELTRSGENNLVTSMNAKVAGVQVTSASGVPGAAARIRIRGNTSITGNNSPLFVVDGIPIENSGGGSSASLDGANRAIDLNPNDVESMTVLKGPAATALYGIRAANGAVIITTKKGARGAAKTRITFNSSVGLDRVNKLPEVQMRYAGGNNGNLTGFDSRQNSAGDSRAWGPSFDSLRYNGVPSRWDLRGDIIRSNDPSLESVRPYDNLNNFFTTGLTLNNYLSFAGGDEKNSFFLSLGNLRQTGIVPGTSFERSSIKLSGESKLNQRLTLSASANYMYSEAVRLRRGANWSAPMVSLLRSPVDMDNANGASRPMRSPEAWTFADGTQRKNAVFDNPFFSAANNPNTETTNRLIGYVQGKYDLNSWLSLTGRAGTDLFLVNSKEIYDIFSAENHNQESYKGSYYERQYIQRDINTDLLLTATRRLSKDVGLVFTLGQNYWITRGESLSLQAYNFIVPNFPDFSNTDQATFQPGWSDRAQALVAVFGDARFSYKNYLYLNFTGRNEWASTLPVENNAFFYPSVNTSFVFTEPLDLATNRYFSFGKLRASWAQVGNIPSPYLTNTYFTPIVNGGFGGTNPFRSQLTQGNPTLLPEIATQIELGTELRFFQNRLSLDFTWYNTLNRNQIIVAQVPASTGFTNALVNGGEIRNSGIELVLVGTAIKRKDWSWELGLNFTRQRSFVEDLVRNFQRVGGVAGFTQGFTGAVVGQEYGVILGASRFKRFGQDPNDLSIRHDLPVVVDAQGRPIIETPTTGGFYIVGNPNPRWIAGFRNTLRYKNFSITGLLDLRKGGDIFNLTRLNMEAIGTHKNTEDRDIARVFPNSVKEDGSTNDIEILFDRNYYSYLGGDFGNVPERGIEDGSWIRLREVALTYAFPARWFEKNNRIQSGSFGISGRNLWLLTNYSGIDPETNAAGNDNSFGRDAFNMPNTKGLLFTLNLQF